MCVWWDAVSGWIGRRRLWVKSPSDVQVEGFADSVCFVLAPALLAAAAVGYRVVAMLVLPVFVSAGIWRLSRFNIEGLAGRGYAGLPVTYNGYLVPVAVLLQQRLTGLPETVWFALCLGVISWLMVSRRFVTPEL